MNETEVYYKRGFLNDQEGLAAFEAYIYQYAGDWVDACFSISDCSRKISLEFGYVPTKLQERLNKIDTLIKELENFREAMLQSECKRTEEKQ
jgi:hypothetical protein